MKQLALILTTLLISTTAFGLDIKSLGTLDAQGRLSPFGGVDSGGGKSVVCRDSNGKITSAEMFDISEGRVLYGYQPNMTGPDYRKIAETALFHIMSGNPTFGTPLNWMLDTVDKAKFLLPPDWSLTPTEDSNHLILPKDCALEQAAVFTSQNQYLIDSEIWNAMNDLNKAALIAHETLYKFMKSMSNEPDSTRVRKAIAHGFATGKIERVYTQLPLGKILYCASPQAGSNISKTNTFFQVYQVQDLSGGGYSTYVEFLQLNGILMLTNTSVRLPDSFDLFKNRTSAQVVEYSYNAVVTTPIDRFLEIEFDVAFDPATSKQASMKVGINGELQDFYCVSGETPPEELEFEVGDIVRTPNETHP